MITYTVEPFSAVYHEMEPLFIHHWKAIAKDQDKIPMDIDVAAYRAAEARGEMHVVVLRVDGVVQGYHISFVRPHQRYKSTLHAIVDVYWVAEEQRKGMAGYRLLKEAEATLKARGVKKIMTATKLSLNMGPLYERLGYSETERLYIKYIGD